MKLKEANGEIARLKAQLAEKKDYDEMKAKIDSVPTFCLVKNKNHGGHHQGEWPTDVWAFLCDCLSTRVSTNVLQCLLRKFQLHFLPWMDTKAFQIPSRRYIDDNRFTMSVAVEICAAMQWAAASGIHMGLDSTGIEGNECMSLWGVLDNGTNGAEMVTLAGCRLERGGTAELQVEFVKEMLQEAQDKVEHVRGLVPGPQRQLVKQVGKKLLPKIRSIMNDTCNCALKTQTLLAEAVMEELKKTPGW